MKLINLHKNIFSFVDRNTIIVNPINVVGMMGKGLALEFKKKFPNYYNDYLEKCSRKYLKVGFVDFYQEENCWICSFPTKDHWKNPSRLKWVEDGLEDLYKSIPKEIERIVFPALGCGLGGLEEDVVHKTIVDSSCKALDGLGSPSVYTLFSGLPEGKYGPLNHPRNE